jgi:YYY domain-containing protein
VPVFLWGIVEIALDGPLKGSSSLLRKLWQLLPLMAILYISLFSIFRRTEKASNTTQERKKQRGDIFVLLLLFTGIFLTLGCELFYIGDVFGNRMNTVFKLYYQAWVMLAIASAYSLYYFAQRLRMVGLFGRLAKYAWWVLLVIFVACSSVYPIAATWSKTGAFAGEPTLDGLAYVKRINPDEYKAIQWLNENIQGSPTIVEATGDEYSEYSRVAAWTGLPTLLGWAGHEIQWRGSDRDFRGRAEDIDLIYLSEDWTQVSYLLKKYDVTYIYVGHLEKAQYGQEVGQQLAEFTDVVFENEGITIYQVRQD